MYYLGTAFAILFFGGFMVKSYWDEHIFERDTRRLLAYYKHAIPGSMLDGNVQNARYVVYKYRKKKATLWRGLEKKYDTKVLLEHEWEDSEEGENSDENEVDYKDLDEEDSTNDKEEEL
mmetsp:Transcript_46248/g.46937  ORF Transcript_46248/g.46937 Transcript_46248/m.46937 type:complete len:119 (-) Transcript_46248:126-482(-)